MDDKSKRSKEVRELLRIIYKSIPESDRTFALEDSTWYEEGSESSLSDEY